jgi:uncharacterized protein YjbI with pentapeptide repeats
MKILVFSLIFLTSIIITPFAFAENTPDWIKNTAGWWADDMISENEFVNAIQFLVNEGIIDVSFSDISKKSQIVPDWIKNTAGWWADDMISENEFVNAIEFLITIGVITISSSSETNTEFCTDDTNLEINKNIKEKLCSNFFDSSYTSIPIFPSSGPPVEVNSHGLRGSEYSIQSEKTFRIFVVGSSTTFGSSNDDAKTIPYLLQENFDKFPSTLNVEVINAGLASDGYSLTLTNLVKEKIINHSPDLIIVHNALNDMNNPLNSPNPAQDWHDRWMEICNIGKSNNFETIVTIQPFVGTGNKILSSDEFRIYTEYDQTKSNIKKYEPFIEKLNDLKQHCTLTVDLTTGFDKIKETVYIDDVHFGDKGSKILADKFFEISSSNIDSLHEFSTQNSPVENTQLEKAVDYLLKSNYSFINMNFENLNLENRDFSGRDLSGSSFYNTNLQNVNFENAKLENVDILGSVLNNANFKNAILTKSNIINSNFKNVNFENTDISNSFLFHLDLETVNLNNSKILNSKILDSNVKNVNFENTDISNTDFIMTDSSYDLNISNSQNVESYKPIMKREQHGDIVTLSSKRIPGEAIFTASSSAITEHSLDTLNLIDDATSRDGYNIKNEQQNTVVLFPEATLLATAKNCIFDYYYVEATSECFTTNMLSFEDKYVNYIIDNKRINFEVDFTEPHPLNYLSLFSRYQEQPLEYNFSSILGDQSSNYAVQALHSLDYTIISDLEIEKTPEILSTYDKVIVLHNKYVTKSLFDSITNHPKVIYLYPESLAEEITINFSEKTITASSPLKYPQEKNYANDFKWEYDNSHLKYVECNDSLDIKFEKVNNGIMLNCNMGTPYPWVFGFDIFKIIKEF